MTINKKRLKKIIKEETRRLISEIGAAPDMNDPDWHPNDTQDWERQAAAEEREEYADGFTVADNAVEEFAKFAREYNEDPSQYTTEQLDGVVSEAMYDVLFDLRSVASRIGVRGDDFKQRVAAALAEL